VDRTRAALKNTNHEMTRISPHQEIFSNTKSLADRLRERIRREGPISFYDWMQAALYDEREGYYCRPGRVRQGRSGDYRTAPETSSLFAATFARYFAKLFAELGSPLRFTIVEAGAGAGEFAHGVLTVLRTRYADLFGATQYVLDEVSADSRALAAYRLAGFSDRISFQNLTDISVPIEAGIIFSNELIDAFPVHRVTMRNGELCELCVAVEEQKFVWLECTLGEQVTDYLKQTSLKLLEGQVAEINPDAERFVAQAGRLLEKGFLITVDYGAERTELLNSPERRDGTLRAFRRHQLIGDALSHPGEVDLTTTIDWTQIREAAACAQLETIRLEPLDRFLLAEGLLDELEELTRHLPDSEALRLRTSAREMVMPYGMAASFQVLVQQKP